MVYAAAMPVDIDPSAVELDPEAVAAWMTEDATLQLVDVREDYEREAGHIPGSRHIELALLPARAGELDGARPVVFYCRVGARSELAALAFRASGLQAHSLSGGLLRWAREGRPLAPAGGRVADH
jgi:rhodanese-related sulfurtransferase